MCFKHLSPQCQDHTAFPYLPFTVASEKKQCEVTVMSADPEAALPS